METTNKPQIVILIAPSGAGKSTFAKEFIRNNPSYVCLNADTLRGVIGENESDQLINARVFSVLTDMTKYFMKLGNNILVDNTNYNLRNRKTFVDLGKANYYEVIAVTFDTDLATCLIRNESRERRVPLDVLHRQFDNYEKPTIEEGFSQIVNAEDFLQEGVNQSIYTLGDLNFEEQSDWKAKLGQ